MSKRLIADYLTTGKENAKTARDLAYMLNCDVRDITQGIEHERREGQPICASCDPEHPGYYLAETADEVNGYCQKLHKRAGEIYKTRQALLKTAENMSSGQEAQQA